MRCILLSVMLLPLVAWKLVSAYLLSPDESLDGAALALPALMSEQEGRQLNAFSGWQAGMEHGYDCLSADEVYDREKISFIVVRKSTVTMGGRDGSGCRSNEGPCLKKGNEVYLLLYIPAMFYMFIALAVICDEFFVPSLEMFVDHYGISMDVAGATFMAAGGSMPELFTSLISVFQESDVGFAAIVGSAVFNVLFVIAVCALASEEPLQLTAWPLARDCTFYILGLMLVVIFFSSNSPNEIEWWEALILFCWYICYCSFMKINESFKNWFDGMFKSKKVLPEGESSEELASAPKKVSMVMPSSFRGGIIQLLTQHASITETAGIAVVTEFKGSLQEVFAEMDGDSDGHIDESEFAEFMLKLGWQAPVADEDGGEVKDRGPHELWRRMPLTNDDKLSFEAFRKWYMVSEARVEIEVRRVFEKLDRNGDGFIDGNEIRVLLQSLGHNPTKEELDDVQSDLKRYKGSSESSDTPAAYVQEADSTAGNEQEDTGCKFRVKYETFEKWYTQSIFCKAHQRQHQSEVIEEGGFSIDWPEDPTCWQLFWYFFTYPLCAAMFCTLPDVRRPGMEGKVRWAIIEFILSLVWIAIFSLTLYECTVTCSNTIGIPPPVAAVTIIAAGTSVPDLLSSYIVARQGEGDMAVSSSIGSNIFDITVGLPIPWLLYSATRNGGSVRVQTTSIGLSVLVLMVMLTMVIFTIMCMRWRMNKAMGFIMLLLYFIFLLLDVLRQLPSPTNPVLKVDF